MFRRTLQRIHDWALILTVGLIISWYVVPITHREPWYVRLAWHLFAAAVAWVIVLGIFGLVWLVRRG